MIDYQTRGPVAGGDYLIGYPTPGAPHLFTAAGCASNETAAKSECARRNEAQVLDRRAAMVRKANMIVRDREN